MVLELKKSPTLQDFQSYVRQMKQERGFNTTDKFYECCLFAEEAGEVISAVRKNAKGGSVGSGQQCCRGACRRIHLCLFAGKYARH